MVKLGDVTEIVVKGQKNSTRPLGVGKHNLVIGTGKANISGMDGIEALGAEGISNISIHTLIAEDVHRALSGSSGKMFSKDTGGFVRQTTGVFEGCEDVLFGDAGELDGDFIKGIASSNQVEHINDGNSGAADARLTETDFGIGRDLIHKSSFVNERFCQKFYLLIFLSSIFTESSDYLACLPLGKRLS